MNRTPRRKIPGPNVLSTVPAMLKGVILWMLFISPGCGWAEKPADLKLNIPAGVQLTVFADKAWGARHMAFDDQGVLFLTRTRKGKVVALPDINKDGRADQSVMILDDENNPHGLAFVQLDSGYYLYVAEEDRVIRIKRTAKPYTYGKPEVIVPDIPTGGHSTRTIKIKDGRLYLSVGSSVMSPMIFEKSLSMARNVWLQKGERLDEFTIVVNDLAEAPWDWSRGEPPVDNPAYYVRFCKSFSRMGGTLRYVGMDNRVFLQNLYARLREG